MKITDHSLQRMRSQLAEGRLVLFTGAGFSRSAQTRDARQLPSVRELKQALFALCFPSEELDDDATLGELFQIALNRQRSGLLRLLQERLTVDPERLPDFYRFYFDFPWQRYYTLNIDDLAIVASQKFELRRPLQVISATTGDASLSGSLRSHPSPLQAVHLNGIISDPPESLTFSEDQYAKRLANREPWYSRLVADITSQPGVFIGTELREVPFWQHLELRRRASNQGRDLRPSSILVTPRLSASRQEILNELRLEWFEGDAESFAQTVLVDLQAEAAAGFTYIDRRSRLAGVVTVPLVSELAAENPVTETGYLIGEEPQWSDLLTGRAAEREHFGDLLSAAEQIIGGELPNTALAVTGTAGTGKSTALMRLALRLSADGLPVLWVDKDSEAGPAKMRERVRSINQQKLVLAVDDADLFGNSFVALLRDLVHGRGGFLFVFAMRAHKLDSVSSVLERTGEVKLLEHVVPNLTEGDIDSLIATLDKHNRLGVLKGRSFAERRAAFSEKAGGQLLVAMLEATSGEKFEVKVFSELDGLEGITRLVYGLVSVASAYRHHLTKDEIFLAVGQVGDEGLGALDRLVARHLLAKARKSTYRARHRVIAELVLRKLQESGELREILVGLAFAAAAKVDPENRQDRLWRLLARILNHAFLLRVLGVMDARAVYSELENVLSFDYHYWLQRGSLEVEAGDVRLGANFLRQARSMKPGDYRIETEYAYMLIRRAYENPAAPRSEAEFGEALETLEDVILHRGKVDSYPYHVLGSQGLAWVNRTLLGTREKRELLDYLRETVRRGLEQHPSSEELRKLSADLEKASLMTVVQDGAKG